MHKAGAAPGPGGNKAGRRDLQGPSPGSPPWSSAETLLPLSIAPVLGDPGPGPHPQRRSQAVLRKAELQLFLTGVLTLTTSLSR